MNEWDDFDINESGSSTDGVWFLFEPAEPPFPCTPPEAEVWVALERQMWSFFVQRCFTDEVKPLFPDELASE